MRRSTGINTILGALAYCFLCLCQAHASEKFQQEVIVDGLNHPWGFVFLSPNEVLVTERSGSLKRLSLNHLPLKDNKAILQEIKNAPTVVVEGQGGLLDVTKHPDFDTNRYLYFSYSKQLDDEVTLAVARGELSGERVVNMQDIFVSNAASNSAIHFGSRLVFDENKHLFITIGDRGERDLAQDLSFHAGKVIRITDTGQILTSNPFIQKANAQPEIYSWGHRNPQGMVYDKTKKQLWINEHGPRGGDEVNLIQSGNNYGWPVITYGREYNGDIITDETHKPGMEQPQWKWVPSIAPSGMAQITAPNPYDLKPGLMVGALKDRLIAHLEVANNTIIKETRFPIGERVRQIKVGPDNFLYIITDSSNGKLIRLKPQTTTNQTKYRNSSID